MPKLIPQEEKEAVLEVIDTDPGVTIREIAERTDRSRDSIKHMVMVTLQNEVVEYPPKQEYVRCGKRPRGFAAW